MVGRVNPLVSAFIALFALDRAPRFLVFCSGAIVRFLLLSVALARNGELCVGFYAWLAGILLLIYRDFCKVMARIFTFIWNWG